MAALENSLDWTPIKQTLFISFCDVYGWEEKVRKEQGICVPWETYVLWLGGERVGGIGSWQLQLDVIPQLWGEERQKLGFGMKIAVSFSLFQEFPALG